MSAQNQKQIQNATSSLITLAKASTLNQMLPHTQKTQSKTESKVKLRFHLQALPLEYLRHYNASQGQQQIYKNLRDYKKFNQRIASKTANYFQKQSQSKNSHENVRSWLKTIADIRRTTNESKESIIQIQKPIDKLQCEPSAANNDCNKQNGLETKYVCLFTQSALHDGHFLTDSDKGPNFKRPHYSDLPYMGEITLHDCKPRRGRKPKRADICHLIYKNYGTIPPMKPKPENRSNYTSSILNKENHCFKKQAYEKPLNLCLRDQLVDSYSISSSDEVSETNFTCPTSVSTPFDYICDSMLANNLKKSLNNIDEQNEDEKGLNNSNQSVLSEYKGIVKHSIATCYKKLLQSSVLPSNVYSQNSTIKKTNQFDLKLPIPSSFFLPQELEQSKNTQVKINLDLQETSFRPSSIQLKNSVVTAINLMQNQPLIAPQKRKRSAIFIPPMNVENSNRPATEVSICKFKFTGGSKPSLEEEKIVSVDAGGNYRYFSGTGDKASRGYEYFPRESLQHMAGLLSGMNCTGQRLCIDMTPSSNKDLLKLPDYIYKNLLSGKT